MATLKKRHNNYSIFIRQTINGKQTDIAVFNLGKVDKEIALKRKKKVERIENDIKNGIIKEWEFALHLDWLSDDRNEINNRTLAKSLLFHHLYTHI